ncbi:MAG: hypothetical protein CMN30_16150 [Sandaracinus sp.]|nr:hypothetical protein [Sandaracinus sp.]
MTTYRLLLASCLLFGAACAEEEAVPSEPAEPAEPAAVTIDVTRRTTDGMTAVRNLDLSVDGARAHFERIGSPLTRSRLIGLLDLRAAMTGAYDDFRELDELTAAGIDRPEPSSSALLERAGYLSAVHRFEESRAMLDRAEAAGASATSTRGERLIIDLALGRDPSELLPIARAMLDERPDFDSHARLAGVLAALGRFEEADAEYRAALASYDDVAPFPVAWNAFQRGVMWAESADRPDLARPLYEEAVRRLPVYVVANVHLAELEATSGEVDTARARLRTLVDRGAEDPEPAGYLGELGVDDAGALIAQAAARYEVLLGRHREAFADHGSEFFAGPGGDPARGLELALFNLENRRNARAYVVAIEAAGAAGEEQRACDLALEAEPYAERHPVLRHLVTEIRSACPSGA